MSGSPIPIVLPGSEWTLYTSLQLALPAVAIVAAALIAWYGWHHALKTALTQQAAAAQLAREERAHDRLVALLEGYVTWLIEARVILHMLWVEWGSSLKTRGEARPPADAGSQKFYELQFAKLMSAAKTFDSPTFWIRDAALVYPMDEKVVFYLEVLGGSLKSFWELFQQKVQASSIQPDRLQQDASAADEGMRYAGMVSSFCTELRVLVVNALLKKQYGHQIPGTSLWPEQQVWLTVRDGRWLFKKYPPNLSGVHFSNLAAEMRQAYVEELKTGYGLF